MSKKIDLSTYNLIYKRRSDGRKFLGKMITKLNRRVIDSVSGEVIDLTEYRLRKEYQAVEKANRRNIKNHFSNRYKWRTKKESA